MAAARDYDEGNDSDVCDLVQEDASYQQLLDGFIDAAVERAGTGQGDPGFAEHYRAALVRLVTANRAVVDAFQHVSMEKILLRSLILGALKWDPLGLIVEPFELDPPEDASNHQAWYRRFTTVVQPLIASRRTWPELVAAAGPALREPAPSAAESGFLELLALRQRYFGRHRTVHLSLTPPFSPAEGVDPPLRIDLWFWTPSDPGFGVIAECAGFQPHTRAGSNFSLPPPEGAHALRFPGIDVFRNPIAVCSEILGALG